MTLLQKYRSDETRKTTPDEEKKKIEIENTILKQQKPIAPKESQKKNKIDQSKILGVRSRPVISATVSTELVEVLNILTEEKYLNRSKFIEDALIRTIKTEFPDIARKYNL